MYNTLFYFLVFFIYSFLGWVMECTLTFARRRKFVNRGFLIGPICPIYGCGAIGGTLILTQFKDNLVALFFLAILLCGTLEYLTSYIMEKIFKARWWDYSERKFNINGRVCLETLIPFGVLSVLIIKFMNPFFYKCMSNMPNGFLIAVICILVILYLIDYFVSSKIIFNFRDMNKKSRDSTEEISNKVKQATESAIAKLMEQRNNLLKKVKVDKYIILKNVRYTRKIYTQKIRNTKITLIGTFKKRVQNIDDKIRKITKESKENQSNLFNSAKEGFCNKSKLNKRLISAFPNIKQMEFKRKKKGDKKWSK